MRCRIEKEKKHIPFKVLIDFGTKMEWGIVCLVSTRDVFDEKSS